MRIVKEAEIRRSEILDAAESLFLTKGYDKATIIDILKATGIAKGTFYYHFSSKEEVMDGIIDRIVDRDAALAQKIIDEPDIPIEEKFFRFFMGQQVKPGDSKEKVLSHFNQAPNPEFRQKSLVKTILRLSPLLADLVEQGKRELKFRTDHPRAVIEFLLASSTVMFDPGLFSWTPEEYQERSRSFISIMETVLGAKAGSFDYIFTMLEDYRK